MIWKQFVEVITVIVVIKYKEVGMNRDLVLKNYKYLK